MTGGPDQKHLPLEDLHVAATARFGPFADWSMPITYPAGVMKEHLHAREHAGLFDISHMQLFELSGPGAADLIARPARSTRRGWRCRSRNTRSSSTSRPASSTI